MTDENSVIVSGVVHSHESRQWQDKTFSSIILRIAGEREYNGVVEEIEDYVKIGLPGKLANKLVSLQVGTRVRVEGRLKGRLGASGGAFMEITPMKFSYPDGVPRPGHENPPAAKAGGEVPF